MQAIEQAQRFALGTELLASQRLTRLMQGHAGAAPPSSEWNDKPMAYPIDDGLIRIRLRDAGACFNLNGVVEGAIGIWKRNDLGARQYAALLEAVGVDAARAQALSDTLVDWIDSDQRSEAQGAEDEAYATGAAPYRTADTLLAEVSELRAIRGYDADVYARLRPRVCALPTPAQSININSLRAEDAPVVVALTAGLVSLADARRVIASRPANGWREHTRFWEDTAMAQAAATLGNAPYEQVDVRSHYFTLLSEIDHAGAQAVMTSLLELDGGNRARSVARRWTLDE
jgi:general secretion pathway protein K